MSPHRGQCGKSLPVFKQVTHTVEHDSFEAFSIASRMGQSVEILSPRGDAGGESCEDKADINCSPKVEFIEDVRLIDGRTGEAERDRGKSGSSKLYSFAHPMSSCFPRGLEGIEKHEWSQKTAGTVVVNEP